jgi:acetyl-CoA acetyltransferase
LTHADIDVVQVYDCFTVSVLLQLEAAGFAQAGESASWLRESRMPVNTHGGLLSHSYLLGMSHVTEAVRQLRGEALGVQVPDAQHALVLGPPGDSAVTLALSAA